MKNKNARILVEIIKLLYSPDEESVILGIGLFQEHYLLTNIPKNKVFNLPLLNNGYPWKYSRNKARFTKSRFIRMLNSKRIPINNKVFYIISFIKLAVNDCFFGFRNNNNKLFNLISYNNSVQVSDLEFVPGYKTKKKYSNLDNYLINSKSWNDNSEFYNELFEDYHISITRHISIWSVLNAIKNENTLNFYKNQRTKYNKKFLRIFN